ncbi:methyltransferase [Flavobacterium ardleyense]|uniref:methyltransferase n=1 Tax=Flavobacterium ardleyense TaxID=2038737 RepID=UPI00298D1B83|nr:methyltransferase [Flavobacterium ardleyense]
MNWKDIKTATDNTHFLYDDNKIFNRNFIEVLKFHTPGVAPVKDYSGAFHITDEGKDLYNQRYERTFGFYCNRAAVISDKYWFHIDERGQRISKKKYAWTGNFQEEICTVRNGNNEYFHIDILGNKIYKENYIYAGDFKDGIACVKLQNGNFKHIDSKGKFINESEFVDLGIFHKKYATAKDRKGWFHIDINGIELYSERYLLVEPFYNGFALVTSVIDQKSIINEKGELILIL